MNTNSHEWTTVQQLGGRPDKSPFSDQKLSPETAYQISNLSLLYLNVAGK